MTIGIGANDGSVSSIAPTADAEAGAEDPLGSPCTTADAAAPDPLLARVDKMRSDLTPRLLGEVRNRAPDAEVLVVGYPQVVPETGTCRDRLPLATDDYAWFRGINEALDEVLRRAADDAGVGIVDTWAASEGHDVCSDEPWVNGQEDVPGIALAYHPLVAHQQAVADLVAEAAGLDD